MLRKAVKYLYKINSQTHKRASRRAQLYGFGCVINYVHLLTAITNQTNHKKDFESVAKQRFQNLSWFGFKSKAL